MDRPRPRLGARTRESIAQPSSQLTTRDGVRTRLGFSLIELMIVVSVCMIIGGISFILAQSTVRMFRLYGSCTSYANLLQIASGAG
jgi:Tfp pilus assembly protein FimT